MKNSKKIISAVLCGAILFVYVWLILTASHPALPSAQKPLLFYSNQTRDDLKLTFREAIKKSLSSISLQMYALTDPALIELLQQKEKEGAEITLVYDASASGKLNKKLTGASPAQTKGLMHRKILVLDKAQVFLGSANFTTQSLQMHDNLMIGLHHEGLAQFLTNPDQNPYSFKVQGQEAEMWLLPDPLALQRLIKLIESARKTIHVAMFTFTHPELTGALSAARSRGVDVRVVVDFYTGRGASSKAVLRMQQNAIPIYFSRGMQLLHHKWAVIDQSILIAGSANWTKSAFERNQDCFLVLHDLTVKQKGFLKKLWKTIENESEAIVELGAL